MTVTTFSIVTDTSTIAVFDLETLRRRIDEDGDWWTSDLFPELQEELSKNNLYLIETLCDGKFEVSLDTSHQGSSASFINCPSGKVYIVCGEEIPGEGLIPELLRGGYIHSVEPGKVSITHSIDGSKVRIHLWQ